LLLVVGHACQGSQVSFAEHLPWRTASGRMHLLLDFRCKPQEGHDLADAGAGDAFAACDGCLAFDLAGVELALPFLGEAQELSAAGTMALLGQLRLRGLALPSGAPARSVGHQLAGGHLTRDPADVAPLEGGLRAECDLDRLVGITALVAVLGVLQAYGAEDDLRRWGAGAFSRTVTFGEPTLL